MKIQCIMKCALYYNKNGRFRRMHWAAKLLLREHMDVSRIRTDTRFQTSLSCMTHSAANSCFKSAVPTFTDELCFSFQNVSSSNVTAVCRLHAIVKHVEVSGHFQNFMKRVCLESAVELFSLFRVHQNFR